MKPETAKHTEDNPTSSTPANPAARKRKKKSSSWSFESDLTELELLRSEIENLQFELAERDRQIAAQKTPVADDEHEESIELQELVEQFEARMKDMANELENSEERIRTLNDLLQACEEANLAERDERQHMEKWLTEIESRLGESDQGLKLEIKHLEERCDKKDDLLARAEQQIRKMMLEAEELSRNGNADEQQGQKILELKSKVEQLEREIEDLTTENTGLKEQSESLDVDPEEVRKLNQKIALLEMEAARERAQISRERVELAAAQDELLKYKKESNHRNEADNRIRAMREHLREIHSNEKANEPEKTGLSGRISRLLGKV